MVVPGLLAVSAAQYHLNGRDLLIAGVLGLVNTAFAFTLFMGPVRILLLKITGGDGVTVDEVKAKTKAKLSVSL